MFAASEADAMKRWVISLLMVPGLLAASAMDSNRLGLVVREYNLAGIPDSALARAQAEAARLFRGAGIQIEWQRGDPGEPEAHSLDMSMLKRSSVYLSFRQYVAVRILRRAPPGFARGLLGTALPFARQGVQATVFAEPVEDAATQLSLALTSLLGYTLAHEIGHVLLGSANHSTVGIMRAVWDRNDYYGMACGEFRFSDADAAQMRAALQSYAHAG
jgi:hypothetical protein